MTIKDVKLKWIDDKSPYVYPSRTVEIVTSEGRILTPTRAATIYEFNQQTTIPITTPVKNPISFSVKKMNKNKLIAFLKGNGLYASWSKQIGEDDDRMKYSFLRAHIMQPTTSTQIIKNEKGEKIDEIESGVDYLVNNSKEREKFIRLILKMQQNAGLDTVTIPYLRLPFSEYKTYIKDIVAHIRSQNKEPLVIFDLQYEEKGDKFEQALSFLINDQQVKLIAFPNRSFEKSAISYDTISTQYAGKDVAFLTFEVGRTFSRNNDLSKMHSEPFIGTDVYAVKTPRYVPPADESEEFVKTKESIDFFNQDNLLVESSTVRMTNPEKILSEMGESKNKRLATILGDYDTIGNDPEKITVINALSKFHELKTSTLEFDVEVQKRIKARESKEYIEERDSLKSVLTKLQTKKRKK